ncbi:hypothetical protein H8D83_02035 [Candidatus Woesearchaeota archaeon]|nr:hypothetical protein [Candidatus Woesearchaeota archaeon]MBL7051087.1 hypothetical protein [Candidatus Woesearchaeota archaeon]
MKNLVYKGLHKLNKKEEKKLDVLTKEYFEKIKLVLKDLKSIQVDINTHHTEGKRKRYDLSIKAIAPSNILRTQVDEWDLSKTAHKGFKKIIKEAQHKVKYSGRKVKSGWKLKGLLKKTGLFGK